MYLPSLEFKYNNCIKTNNTNSTYKTIRSDINIATRI